MKNDPKTREESERRIKRAFIVDTHGFPEGTIGVGGERRTQTGDEQSYKIAFHGKFLIRVEQRRKAIRPVMERWTMLAVPCE